MKRLISFLFWSFLFLVVCLGLDQLMVRVEMPLPVLAEVQTFYVDFRTRLLKLGHRMPVKRGGVERKAPASAPARPKAASVQSTAPPAAPMQPKAAPVQPKAASAQPKAAPVQPKVPEPAPSSPEKKSAPAKPSPAPTAGESNPHYLYVDKQGELRFADRLEEVPAAYRKDAQRLEK